MGEGEGDCVARAEEEGGDGEDGGRTAEARPRHSQKRPVNQTPEQYQEYL